MASLIHEPARPRKPWRVDWLEGGRHRTRRFRTKRLAEAYIGDIARGAKVNESDMTVTEWFAVWLRTRGPEWEDRVLNDREREGVLRIEPYLGHRRLRDLTRREIREWRAEVQEEFTPYVAQFAFKQLSACLGCAVEGDLLEANPCAGIKPLTWQKQEREPVPLAQVELIRSLMPAPRDRAAVSLMAYGGVRPSELVRLQAKDVRDKTIVVRRGARRSGETKSGSVRSIPIIEPIAEDLADLPDDRTLLGISDWNSWARNRWRGSINDFNAEQRKKRRTPIERPVPYALRHTAASLWIAEGRTVLEVAQLLGHSTPTLTLRTYGHLFAEAQLAKGEPAEAAIMRARHETRASRT